MSKRLSIFAALCLSLLASCTKESIKTLYSSQETKIETLVKAQLESNETYTSVSNGGSTRLTVVAGEGEPLTDDKLVSFYYAGYVLTGASLPNASTLFATNSEEVATAAKWNLTKADPEAEEDGDENDSRFEIKTVKLGEANFVEGLYNGMTGVQGGEECWIFFSGKHGFGSERVGVIPANSAIAYHIWVHSVQSDEI